MKRALALCAALAWAMAGGPAVAQTAPAVTAPAAAEPATPESAAPPPAPQIVTGLSQDAVSITTSFTGSEFLIYGAIRGQAGAADARPPGSSSPSRAPPQGVTVRRKDRVAGIWVNTQSLRITAAPDFHVVASSGRLSLMLDRDEDVRYRISPPLSVRALAVGQEVDDATAFTGALLRVRAQSER